MWPLGAALAAQQQETAGKTKVWDGNKNIQEALELIINVQLHN